MLTLLFGISGCSWFNFFGDDDLPKPEKNTIARVIHELPEIELPTATVSKPTREEVMLAYERVYGLLPDLAENHAVGKRLADLQMSVGEDKDIEGQDDPYGAAVELYESLLLSSDGEGKDEIIYQLARAYDIVGKTDQAIHYLNRLIMDNPEFAVDAVTLGELDLLRSYLTREVCFHKGFDHADMCTGRTRVQTVLIDKHLPGGDTIEVSFLFQVIVGQRLISKVLPGGSVQFRHLCSQRFRSIEVTEG